MQHASEIQIPVWKNKQKTIKIILLVDWLQKIRTTKTYSISYCHYTPVTCYALYLEVIEKCLKASRLITFLFHLCNSLFLSTLCPICLPKSHWDSLRMMNGRPKADQSLAACGQSFFLYPRFGGKETRMIGFGFF